MGNAFNFEISFDCAFSIAPPNCQLKTDFCIKLKLILAKTFEKLSVTSLQKPRSLKLLKSENILM